MTKLKLICPLATCKAVLEINDEQLTEQRPNVRCPKCLHVFKAYDQKATNNDDAKEPAKTVVHEAKKNVPTNDNVADDNVAGWIVVHDENTDTQTFELQIGTNTVGRKADKKLDIPIATNDRYMSRQHCVFTVKKGQNAYLYTVSDFGKMGEKESTNGTFLNGQAHRFLRDKEYPIADGDTLQIGRTKIVLKTKQTVKNDVEAAKMVQDMDYEKTIIH